MSDVNISKAKPKSWTEQGPAPLGMEGVADPLKHAPHDKYYNADFCHSTSQGIGISRGEPPKLRSAGPHLLGWWTWLTPKNTTHVLFCRIFRL